jgi:hypothetical protein
LGGEVLGKDLEEGSERPAKGKKIVIGKGTRPQLQRRLQIIINFGLIQIHTRHLSESSR